MPTFKIDIRSKSNCCGRCIEIVNTQKIDQRPVSQPPFVWFVVRLVDLLFSRLSGSLFVCLNFLVDFYNI